MRQFDASDKISASAQKEGRHSLPKTGVYVPSYSGVNQSVAPAPNAVNKTQGKINFMHALAAMGKNYVAKQQELYDSMEISQAMSRADNKYRQESEKFFQENPSGKGYTEYITDVYSQAVQEELGNASTNVEPKLKLLFDSRKEDVANHAFQKEKEVYTGYALNETQTMLNGTINEVMQHPNEVKSLSNKYEQQLENMRGILPAGQFEQYQKEAHENFLYAYGHGLIETRPYDAINLVKGSDFVNGLSPQKFSALQQQATAKVEHIEAKARAQQRMIESAMNEERMIRLQELEMSILTGQVPTEAEIKADNILDNKQKIKAILFLREHQKKTDKYEQDKQDMQEVVKGDKSAESIRDVPAKTRNRYLSEYFTNEDAKREAAGEKPYSLTEKVKFCADNQTVFSSVYAPLKNEIEVEIKKGTNGLKLMDACIALAGQESVPAIKGMDEDIVQFAHLAIDVFNGTKDLQSIVALRDDYFSVTPDQEARNKERAKILYPNNQDGKEEALKKFYENSGYRYDTKWYMPFRSGILQSPDKQRLNDIVYSNLRRAYIKTGSETKAQSIAASILSRFIVEDDLHNYSINPPRPENTGLSQAAIDIQVKKDKEAALTIAKNSGQDLPKGIKPDDLHLESVDFDEPRYSIYYLLDKEDPDSRDYLYKPNGEKIICNLWNEKKSKESK